MWERYCRGVQVIVFVVDSAPTDSKQLQQAKTEIQNILLQPTLAHIPFLLLFNKNDLETAVPPTQLIQMLEVENLLANSNSASAVTSSSSSAAVGAESGGSASLGNRDVSYYSISCKNIVNIDKTLEWIIKRAKKT